MLRIASDMMGVVRMHGNLDNVIARGVCGVEGVATVVFLGMLDRVFIYESVREVAWAQKRN